jgi:hypothetical protein
MGVMRVGGKLPKWARNTIAIVAIWDIVWKGAALWQAAKRRQPVWFAVLLIANTAGALPITYLVLMRRRDAAREQEPDTSLAEEQDASTDT